MKLSIFLPLATFLSLTFAEDFSPCAVREPFRATCLDEGALVAGCASVVDYHCTCTSPAFRAAVTTCLKVACTAEDAASMYFLLII
ncbi:hypothetical protein N7510_008279 [Penicillium lagena]|uniref:uncharacterized protein n=1 Tax=Penicillium lagena TaxID=94218 RepID=UPI002540BD55|nr:uncharacterized protein N7510_008279 [Penicillium lagena]KAJ5605498.1 hypothetical protein N7510_008279 [Penicillium lagena]